MQVLLNDKEKLFKNNIKKFISEYLKNNKQINLKSLWQALYKNDFIGKENSFLKNVVLIEAACTIESGLGLFLLTQFTCIEIIEKSASMFIKDNYLSKLYSGEYIGCFSLTEPNAGSDVSMLETNAKKGNSYWIINGQKIWSRE